MSSFKLKYTEKAFNAVLSVNRAISNPAGITNCLMPIATGFYISGMLIAFKTHKNIPLDIISIISIGFGIGLFLTLFANSIGSIYYKAHNDNNMSINYASLASNPIAWPVAFTAGALGFVKDTGDFIVSNVSKAIKSRANERDNDNVTSSEFNEETKNQESWER